MYARDVVLGFASMTNHRERHGGDRALASVWLSEHSVETQLIS